MTVVVDLFSRLIVGWSMRSMATAESVIDALWLFGDDAPQKKVLVHSDQGAQYTSKDWQTFLRDNNLEASMSRRGNCHDNAVAENFFSVLKKKEYAIEPTKQEVMFVQRFLIISNAFIIQSDTMDQIMDYRHCNMRGDILRS